MYGKSFKREKVEGDFNDILHEAFPQKHTLALMEDIMFTTWRGKCDELISHRRGLEDQRRQIVRKVDIFVDRIAEAQNPILITKYEKQITDLEQQRVIIDEKIARCGTTDVSNEEATRTAFKFLGNARNLWDSGSITERRMVLRAAFREQMRYHPNEGYRTAAFSLPFEVSRGFNTGQSGLVRTRGLEPPPGCPDNDLNVARLPFRHVRIV